jgi:hypothetical protein
MFVLTTMLTTGLAAVTLPEKALAQSDPLVGLWKLNLQKSTFSPGPLPKSRTITAQAIEGGHNFTVDSVDAQDKTTKAVLTGISDGKSHPVAGQSVFDAWSSKQISDSTTWVIETKGGKVVQTLVGELSADRKVWTITTAGTTEDGKPLYNVAVYDKQERSLRQQLVGNWELVSCEPPASGPKPPYCGNGAGSLSMHGNGHYTLVILAKGRPKEVPGATGSGPGQVDRVNVTPDYYKSIAQGAVAQFGTWSVNEAENTETDHIAGAFFPRNDGSDSKFSVSLNGDEVKFTGPAGGSTTWRRTR